MRFGATAVNEAFLSITSDLHIESSFGMALASTLASVVAGLWRLLIIPLDTLKTICQVEGIDGLRRVTAKAS